MHEKNSFFVHWKGTKIDFRISKGHQSSNYADRQIFDSGRSYVNGLKQCTCIFALFT